MNVITMNEPLFGAYLGADIEEIYCSGLHVRFYVKIFNRTLVSASFNL